MNRYQLGSFLSVLSFALPVFPALADVAPDASAFGSLRTTSAEYKLDAAVDPEVLDVTPPRAVELWAVVFRPVQLDQAPYPLLVFLHGNHSTCGYGQNPRIDDNSQYTNFGTCPPDYVVVPNHRGYDYLLERLASWGYIIVSINANRGINAGVGIAPDLGLNKARGRLILRHLQKLSEWNSSGGTPESLEVDLQGKLDLNHVGLFGHSRGGEGVRAAYNFYRDADSPWPARIGPVTFEGIFEIGPVDGQTDRLFVADGTPWNVLLPMCDGDVSNLQGVRAFDRVIQVLNETPATQKSTFTVWGTNHNYYNTEWQVSDSPGCTGHDPIFRVVEFGSARQRQVSMAGVMAFFRGNVGTMADSTFNRNFNPQFDLPEVITSVTRVDRGFTDSPSSTVTRVFEDFDQATGTNTYGFPNDANNITINHGMVPNENAIDTYMRQGTQRAAAISWTAASTDTFFQTNWQAPGGARDISTFQTLDLRVSRQCGEPPTATTCNLQNSLNTTTSTNFSIRLVMDDGSASDAVRLNSYTDLTGLVGGLFSSGFPNLHPILQTARIKLSDFSGADLTRVRGVRLTFEDTPSGAIFVGNIRLSSVSGLGADQIAGILPTNNGPLATASAAFAANTYDINSVDQIRARPALPALNNQAGIEIQLTSSRAFEARDELLVARIGDREFALLSYPESGDNHTVNVALSASDFDQLSNGDPLAVQYRGSSPDQIWNFGPLRKP